MEKLRLRGVRASLWQSLACGPPQSEEIKKSPRPGTKGKQSRSTATGPLLTGALWKEVKRHSQRHPSEPREIFRGALTSAHGREHLIEGDSPPDRVQHPKAGLRVPHDLSSIISPLHPVHLAPGIATPGIATQGCLSSCCWLCLESLSSTHTFHTHTHTHTHGQGHGHTYHLATSGPSSIISLQDLP